MIVLWVHHIFLAEILLIWEISNYVRCMNLLKEFAARSLLLSSMAWDKHWMSSCTNCLMRNSHAPIFQAMHLKSLSIVVWISPTNSVLFLLKTISEALSNRNFVITMGFIQLFSNPLHCLLIDCQTLRNIRIGASVTNAKKYSMPFQNFRKIEPHFILLLSQTIRK